uniref:t-SNARE coiled-coil homology domain-containing protein n=2 Tax=Ascaris TaxID=6251 RepID=A0A9J2PG10_ASCLU
MDAESEGGELISSIGLNIQRLSQYVQQLEVLVGRIGGADDGERLREQIAEVTTQANQLSKETNTLMKRLVSVSNENRSISSLKVQRERLMGELIAVLNRLQNAQRDASTREKETMKAVAAQDKHVSQQIENSSETEVQQRRQLQVQHQQHLNELRDRNETMRQLEQDIGDVTQIMKDLARIVHDQGEIVDSIEANVEHASMHVQQGATDVRRAVFYQQKARQKKFFLCVFLVLLVAIIALVLYFFAK